MTKLTKKAVDALKPSPEPGQEIWAWDEELPGFGVRVYPSGRKVYVAQYRAGGRTRRVRLGTHGVVTPDQARAQARAVLVDVARGEDPAEARDQGRQAVTVRELAERYLAEHAATKKKPASAFRDQRLIERFILPALGSKRVEDVTRQDVAKLHHKVGRDTPIQANRVMACLSKIMTQAIRWGLRPDETNPCRFVERFKENKRERYLSGDELARLGAALAQAEREGTGFPPAIACVRLLLLIGARVGEILTLRWSDIDWERGCIFLADSKTGRKAIPLGAAAVELLQALPRHAGNPHVLPGERLGHHLVDVNTTWRKVREAAGLGGVRLHDLRHTWASLGAASGLSLPLIGAVLGHSEPSTTQRYSHLANDPLKQAADLVAGRMAEALAKPVVPKVVPLVKNG